MSHRYTAREGAHFGWQPMPSISSARCIAQSSGDVEEEAGLVQAFLRPATLSQGYCAEISSGAEPSFAKCCLERLAGNIQTYVVSVGRVNIWLLLKSAELQTLNLRAGPVCPPWNAPAQPLHRHLAGQQQPRRLCTNTGKPQ